MCEPVTLASAALGAGGVGLDFLGQSQEAKAQEQRYQINAANVREATALQIESLQLETLQAGQAIGRDKIANSKEALKARAAAQVNAGESGVTGLSVNALVNDVYAQEATTADGLEQQGEFRTQQSSNDLHSTSITARSQINQVSRGQKPSALGALLQLGSAGIDAFG